MAEGDEVNDPFKTALLDVLEEIVYRFDQLEDHPCTRACISTWDLKGLMENLQKEVE